MLKTKPWQIWAMLAVHSVTLAYMIYELVRISIQYPAAGADYAAAVILGIFSLVFLFRGSLTGFILEIVYILSLLYCRHHYADVLEPIQNLLSSKAIKARTTICKLVCRLRSQFFQSLRHLSSQPKVLSTTHRLGRTTN